MIFCYSRENKTHFIREVSLRYRHHACFVKKAQERLIRRTQTFSGTGRLKALITLEQVNTSVVDKINLNEHNCDGEANWSGVVDFHCMQMSLVISLLSIFVGNDITSPESRPFIFVYLFTRTQSVRKQIVNRIRYKKVIILRNIRLSIKQEVNNFQRGKPVWFFTCVCSMHFCGENYTVSKDAKRKEERPEKRCCPVYLSVV